MNTTHKLTPQQFLDGFDSYFTTIYDSEYEANGQDVIIMGVNYSKMMEGMLINPPFSNFGYDIIYKLPSLMLSLLYIIQG